MIISIFFHFKLKFKYLYVLLWVIKSIRELYFVNFPFLCCKSTFYMTCKSLAWLWISGIFEIIVTDRELSIRFLNIWIINNTNIATSENWTLFRITSYSELSQIQIKSLTQINRENKWAHRFICRPMFFAWIPSQRSITTNRFPVLSFNKGHSFSNIIAFFMEF